MTKFCISPFLPSRSIPTRPGILRLFEFKCIGEWTAQIPTLFPFLITLPSTRDIWFTCRRLIATSVLSTWLSSINAFSMLVAKIPVVQQSSLFPVISVICSESGKPLFTQMPVLATVIRFETIRLGPLVAMASATFSKLQPSTTTSWWNCFLTKTIGLLEEDTSCRVPKSPRWGETHEKSSYS